MEEQLNPAFTSVSHLMFHSPHATDEQLFQAAQQLEALSKDLAKAPANPSEADPQFRVYATQLHLNAHALATAIGERAPKAELEHWFGHVRASCEGCHGQFKEEPK
jgi:hypothetical protein